jgi:hypothetical protein
VFDLGVRSGCSQADITAVGPAAEKPADRAHSEDSNEAAPQRRPAGDHPDATITRFPRITRSREGRGIMTLTIEAEALFASPLQPSDQPDSAQIEAAITRTLEMLGGAEGCAAWLAHEFGDHPETAVNRMRWALATAAR